METRTLSIESRTETGKQAAKRLRRAGRIPGTLYGGEKPENVAVDPRDILRLIHGNEGGTQLVQLTFKAGGAPRMAIIRDMQFDPVSEHLVHADLQEVRMDRAIQVTVPVRHVGDAIGVRDTKGILEMILREVQVSCLPGLIPSFLEADVSNLAIGDVFVVRDLPAPEGVRILTDGGQAVATVAPPAAEETPVVAAAAVPEAAAVPAEPDDGLAKTLRGRFATDGGHLVGTGRWRGETVYLVKPVSFMNVTGPPVARVARRLHVGPADLILVYDDIDLALGKVRVRMKGSAGGHNGVRSVIEALGTEEIRRVKLGIGRPGEPGRDRADVPDHVLSPFLPEEAEIVQTACEEAARRVLHLIETRARLAG